MPLTVSTQNPNYFVDTRGKAVLLVGSHYWGKLQDSSGTNPPAKFNYFEYTDWMKDNNYNFMRLWAWESPRGAPWTSDDSWYFDPMPFDRTSESSGNAADGKPKFDLTKLNQDYFDRL